MKIAVKIFSYSSITFIEALQKRIFERASCMMRKVQKLLKFTTREGSKAANGNSLFRIENVILVTSLRDAASKQKEHQQRRKKQPQNFQSILDQACSGKGHNVQKEISYSANGYTRNGAAYYCFEKKREYVH